LAAALAAGADGVGFGSSGALGTATFAAGAGGIGFDSSGALGTAAFVAGAGVVEAQPPQNNEIVTATAASAALVNTYETHTLLVIVISSFELQFLTPIIIHSSHRFYTPRFILAHPTF
jgi:hypothetical protein